MMSFLFERRYNVVEPFDVGGTYASHDVPFQIGQVTADAARQLSAPRGQRDEKGAAICFPDFARDQAALGEPIENAG
jgi:hypothetical protein